MRYERIEWDRPAPEPAPGLYLPQGADGYSFHTFERGMWEFLPEFAPGRSAYVATFHFGPPPVQRTWLAVNGVLLTPPIPERCSVWPKT